MQGRQQVLAQGKARVFRKFLMLIKERFLIVPEKIIKIPATHKAKPTTGSVNFYPQKTFCVSFRFVPYRCVWIRRRMFLIGRITSESLKRLHGRSTFFKALQILSSWLMNLSASVTSRSSVSPLRCLFKKSWRKKSSTAKHTKKRQQKIHSFYSRHQRVSSNAFRDSVRSFNVNLKRR